MTLSMQYLTAIIAILLLLNLSAAIQFESKAVFADKSNLIKSTVAERSDDAVAASHTPTSSHVAILNSSGTEGQIYYVDAPIFSPEDSEFILSVTVRIYCNTADALIYYTLDNSIPSGNNSNASITHSGVAILISKVGNTVITAVATKQGLSPSPIVKKTYSIMDICSPPVFTHKTSIYGSTTFAGTGEVTVSSSTISALIYYTFDCLAAPINIEAFPYSTTNGGKITLPWVDKPGERKEVCIHAVAYKKGYATSSTSQSSYTVLAKVKTPLITPSTNEFTISSTLYITSPTTNSTLRYTTDGSDPTDSSMYMTSGSVIIIEQLGTHTIKAFASLDKEISSDVAVKTIKIFERVGGPIFLPNGGSFIDDLEVMVECPANVLNNQGARVHYTTFSSSTPTIYSPSVRCGDPILLKAPGKFTLRVLVSGDNMSPSAVVQALFILMRPHFDEFPVLSRKNVTIDCLPVVTVEVVEKDIPVSSYCPSRLIRGRMIVMENPIGHFDMLDPLGGCNSGKLELPSISGRKFKAHHFLDNSSFYEKYSNLTDEEWLEWESSYKQVSDLGCEIVTNAGFFNVTSGHCFGNIVSQGNVLQSGSHHNINFGIRNGSYYIGYVNQSEILNERNPFDTMMSGISWLVRRGKSYVAESISSSGDNEDLNTWQTTGLQFASVLSARTAIGYDKLGRLRLLQIEGETWVRGMSLYEFADFAVELGIESAINLDGGGSATMTVNHTLVSEPSWKCLDDDGLDNLPNNFGYYRCEKPVSSITCVHATPPPPRKQKSTDVITPFPSPTASPTVDPSISTFSPSVDPSMSTFSPSVEPSVSPTVRPTLAPSLHTEHSMQPSGAPIGDTSMSNSTHDDNECVSMLLSAEKSSDFYKLLSVFLGICLLVSVVLNVCCLWKSWIASRNSNFARTVELGEDEILDDESFIANLEHKNKNESGSYDPYITKDIEMNNRSSPFSIKDSSSSNGASASPTGTNSNSNSINNNDNYNNTNNYDSNESGWKDKLKDMKFNLDDDDDDSDEGNDNSSRLRTNSKSKNSNRLNDIKAGPLEKMVISPATASSYGGSPATSSSRPSRSKSRQEVVNPMSRGGYNNIASKESDDDAEYQPLHKLRHK